MNIEQAINSLDEIKKIFLRHELFDEVIGRENSLLLTEAYHKVEDVVDNLENLVDEAGKEPPKENSDE